MKRQLINISPNAIELGTRFRVDKGDIDELAGSIKQNGVIQPVACWVPLGTEISLDGIGVDTSRPRLVAGERRVLACRQLGMDTMPAYCYLGEPDDMEKRLIELEENVRRKDFTWQEEVELKREIHELKQRQHGKSLTGNQSGEGWSMRNTADFLQESVGMTSEDIALAEATKVMPELLTAKNKTEAKKVMRSVIAKHEVTQAAEAIATRLEAEPTDSVQRRLVDSYVIGDALELLKNLPSDYYDIVELDPPFAIELDDPSMKGGAAGISDYSEMQALDYLSTMNTVLKECYRAAKPNSWLICWFAPEPWFEQIYSLITNSSFQARRLCGEWILPGGQTLRPELYLANCSQPFFYARKGAATIQKPGRSNIFDTPPIAPQKKVHPTEKPIELYEEIISTFTQQGGRLLVPFAGSGNSLLAGANLGFEVLGFDLSQEYKNEYTLKVAANRPPNYSSASDSTSGSELEDLYEAVVDKADAMRDTGKLDDDKRRQIVEIAIRMRTSRDLAGLTSAMDMLNV